MLENGQTLASADTSTLIIGTASPRTTGGGAGLALRINCRADPLSYHTQ
jgi:hypothetical protein